MIASGVDQLLETVVTGPNIKRPADLKGKKVAAPKRQNGAIRPAKLEVLLKAKAREAGLEPQAMKRRGKSRTIGEVRRGFIEAAVLEQGYQASEVASF